MTTTERKQIVLISLGRYSTGLGIPGEEVVAIVEDDMKRAAEHGFDCKLLHLNPADPSEAHEIVVKALQEKQWDGVGVGFGLRGGRDLTTMFEDAMNTTRELAPGAKWLFPTKPDGLLDRIKCAFPERFE